MDRLGPLKRQMLKRSLSINGRKTSVSLENEFWQGLLEIADHNHKRLAMLVEQIDRTRSTCNVVCDTRILFNCFRGKELPARGLAVDPVEGRLQIDG